MVWAEMWDLPLFSATVVASARYGSGRALLPRNQVLRTANASTHSPCIDLGPRWVGKYIVMYLCATPPGPIVLPHRERDCFPPSCCSYSFPLSSSALNCVSASVIYFRIRPQGFRQ